MIAHTGSQGGFVAKTNRGTKLSALLFLFSAGLILFLVLLKLLISLIGSNYLIETVLLASFLSGVLPLFVVKFTRTKPTALWLLSNSFQRDRLTLQLAIISLVCSTYVSLGTTIINIDRSRSVFALYWVECSPIGASKVDIVNQVERKYGLEARDSFEQRIREHEFRRIIREDAESIELTLFGRLLFQIFDYLRYWFDLKGPRMNSIWKEGELDHC